MTRQSANSNRSHHGRPAPNVERGIYAAAVKRDRWVGYVAGDRPGELLSQALPRPQGLTINAATEPSGYVGVEVTNANGDTLPGFSREDGAFFTGDALDAAPTWKSGATLNMLREETVRLRLIARRARVYGLNLG